MSTRMRMLEVVVVVALIAVGGGIWVPLASAGAKEMKPKAPLPETGQTSSFAPGDDGEIRAGMAWPVPRFTDRGNGTVRDNLTGLIWLQDANCSTINPANWATALSHAHNLADGQCGLSDGSVAGDWRLPNVRELLSLADYGFILPALSNAAGTGQCTATDCAFSGVQSSIRYWSSTPRADYPSNVFFVLMDQGKNDSTGDDNPFLVWPVRGGD